MAFSLNFGDDREPFCLDKMVEDLYGHIIYSGSEEDISKMPSAAIQSVDVDELEASLEACAVNEGPTSDEKKRKRKRKRKKKTSFKDKANGEELSVTDTTTTDSSTSVAPVQEIQTVVAASAQSNGPAVDHEVKPEPPISAPPSREPASSEKPGSEKKNISKSPGKKSQRHHQNKHGQVSKVLKKPFQSYLSKEDVSAMLKQGQLIKGQIRINPKNYEDAFVPNPAADGADIFIQGVLTRNRALNGDVVAVQLDHRSKWKAIPDKIQLFKAKGDSAAVSSPPANLDKSQRGPQLDENQLTPTIKQLFAAEIVQIQQMLKAEDVPGTGGTGSSSKGDKAEGKVPAAALPDWCLQMTGQVVYILERHHSRAACGLLKSLNEKSPTQALLSPIDHRLPRILVPLSQCPPQLISMPSSIATTLFVARIIDWPQTSPFAIGELCRSLGEAGEIEPETEGFLIENGVDFSPFPQPALDCLPQNLPWSIPEEELKTRRDFRQDCVFTIDPATARDLDDALCCRSLGRGVYEVGVHIADVSYFVKEGSALDKVAGERATSVYLVQRVVPMLPRLLCEQLCSLNPGEDRLTVSVVWKITEEGEILDEWSGRSVINSYVKLSYDHAQQIIDGSSCQFSLSGSGHGFSTADVKTSVLSLHKIAANLRRQRFDNGALRLDQPKLTFALNPETGMPCGCSVYKQRDSNRLVEEFMLLANMAVAHRIYRVHPKRALLRRHAPPKVKMMDELVSTCQSLGLDVDGSSAGSLQASLSRYSGKDQLSLGRVLLLTSLYTKPMQVAKYFCTGSLKSESEYQHYALNVPLYTHFTSPIRRYADLVVHRLLVLSLGCGEDVKMGTEAVQAQASQCNDRKVASKRVQELSSELFFAVFIKECGPIEVDGIVMKVLDQSFDVLIIKYGLVKRVYCNALPLKDYHMVSGKNQQQTLTLTWDDPVGAKVAPNSRVTTVIYVLQLIAVKLFYGDAPLKIKATISKPNAN